MHGQVDDNALAKRAAEGDAVAFRHLLERHYERVYRLCFRALGNKDDAEDLTQDVCASLARKIRNFRGDAKFSTWLYRVVLNAAHDLRRKQTRQTKLKSEFAEIDALARDEDAQRQKEQVWLYDMLVTLDKDLHDTALLVLAEQMPHAAAGEILGVSEATVSWRMHKLRGILKSKLKDSEIE